MIKVICQKGFAMIEFSLSLVTSLSIAVFFLSLLYTAAAKLWLNQLTYDAVICLAQGGAAATCEQTLEKKAAWIGAKTKKARWKDHHRIWALQVNWRLFKNIEFSTEREISQRSFFE